MHVTMATLLVVLSLFLTSVHASENATSAKDNEQLYKYLMRNKLHKHIRPVTNISSPVVAYFGAALINLEGVDEVKALLDLNIWLRMLWRDEFMTWEPADFNGITTLRMPLDDMWTPDIMLYNAREQTEYGSVQGVVFHDGHVLYIPPARTKSHCDLDFSYYPFDRQECSLKFGSWTYDGFSVDLDFYEGQDTLDLSDYIHSPEWDIIESSAKKNKKYYPCCEEPYPDLEYRLVLARKTSYYTYIYLGPAVVLSLLAPFIFLLPPGDQQKMTLGVGLLVCFTLFFMEMASAIPTVHSHTPLIGKYYMTMYVLLSLAMALSSLVSNLARRTMSLRHPPEIVKKIVLSCLGRCLCVSYNMYADLPHGDEPSEGKEAIMRRQTSSGSQVKEWLLIATVVDRLFFLIYLVLTILLTIIILSARGA